MHDKILFDVGVYREMPDDERAPPKRPTLKIYKTDVVVTERPASANFSPHDKFEEEMEKAS